MPNQTGANDSSSSNRRTLTPQHPAFVVRLIFRANLQARKKGHLTEVPPDGSFLSINPFSPYTSPTLHVVPLQFVRAQPQKVCVCRVRYRPFQQRHSKLLSLYLICHALASTAPVPHLDQSFPFAFRGNDLTAGCDYHNRRTAFFRFVNEIRRQGVVRSHCRAPAESLVVGRIKSAPAI